MAQFGEGERSNDPVSLALALWEKCREASKANPKKGPSGKLGKNKIKRMNQGEAMLVIPKLQKKLERAK